MGDKQQGAAKVFQLGFQPVDGDDIQMVGRLIKQQQVWLADQRPGQLHTTSPAAGQLFHLLLCRQTEFLDHGIHFLAEAPAIHRFKLLLNLFQGFHIGVGADIHGQGVKAADQLAHRLKTRGDHIVDFLVILIGQILIQHAHFQAGLAPQCAIIRHNSAGDQLHHGGFARPVAPQQTDPLATANLKLGVLQQWLVTIGKADFFES